MSPIHSTKSEPLTDVPVSDDAQKDRNDRSTIHRSPRQSKPFPRSRRPRGVPDSVVSSGGRSGSGNGLTSRGSLFMKLTALLLIVAVVDVVHVWKFIDDLGEDGTDPQNSGAEAGLHQLHEGKRRKDVILNFFSKIQSLRGETVSRGDNSDVDGPDGSVIAEVRLDEKEEFENLDRSTAEPNREDDEGLGGRKALPHENLKDVERANEGDFGVDEKILKILRAADVELDAELASQLPTWDNVVSQYGPSPIIRGIETCEPYRQAVKPEDRMIGPAGLFNTGTNLLFELLKSNCDIKEARAKSREPKRNGMRWQVPWGKHNPPSTHRIINVAKAWGKGIKQTDFMPVVLIKDPYHWMGSQCRHKYTTFWAHDEEHCPNLIRWRIKDKDTPTDVHVKYALNGVTYETLLGAWNNWYSEYQEVTFPALHTRFEDLLFHSEDVIKTACDCVGGVFTEKFKYVEESAKKGMHVHKGSNGLVKAILQYGDPKKRLKGFTDRDRWYASKTVRADLMRKFGYSAPPLPT